MTNPRRVDTPLSREQLLTFLLDHDGDWVRIDTIPFTFPMPNYPQTILSRMKRVGLVEKTRVLDGPNAGEYVRITLAGREALRTGAYMSNQRYSALRVRRSMKDSLVGMAKEVGVSGVGAMLEMVVTRREAFVRWYKFMENEK